MAETLDQKVRRLEQTVDRLLRTAERGLDGAVAWGDLIGRPAALTTDPNADRLIFWDDSASALAHLALGAPLNLSGTTMDVDSATATAEGVVELATSAETIAGTDAVRAVTPAGLAAKVASDTAQGLVELATVAEATAGTDSTRAVTAAGLAAGLALLLPSGMILPTGLTAAPTGWLLCDGSAVSRTTYAALYAALGGASSPYGQGNGSSTFNVPNLKGRTIVGIDTGQTEFDVRGETGGSKTHSLSAAESGSPAHQHKMNAYGSSAEASGYGLTVTSGFANRVMVTSAGNGDTSANTAAAASSAHNNLQPYMALHYLIKT